MKARQTERSTVLAGMPAALAALLLTAACFRAPLRELPGPLPETPAKPVGSLPLPPARETAAPAELPENWREISAGLTLAEVLEIALGNSPETRASWFEARSAAAALGSSRAERYPEVDLDASLVRSRLAVVGGQFTLRQMTYGPSLGLSCLLFDFGGRGARVEEARQKLLAADWSHNAAIQNVILQVEEAYYGFLSVKAQYDAFAETVKEAEANLEAAARRREVGVATKADVLQAKTALSQARLVLETLRGRIETTRGALLTAMGLPATVEFEVGLLPAEMDVGGITGEVEQLIEAAMAGRPDLAASRTLAEKAAAHLRAVKAEGRPGLSLGASASRTYYDPATNAPYGDNWSAGLYFSVPLFTGFRHGFELREAEAEAMIARTAAESLEAQVALQVWTAYYELRTAAQRVLASRDLLDSAGESTEVALAQYKAGLGDILNLLTAQTALASARALEIQARSDWLVAVARLAHATGALQPEAAGPAAAAGRVEEEGQP